MSRRSPQVPPYRGIPATVSPTDDPDVGEMAPFMPVAGVQAQETLLQLAPEAQDGNEPELPLDAPEMHERLQAATETALKALPDPSGKDEIVKWAARIEVLQAYKFDGVLHSAPKWIDRNWLAWDEGSFTEGAQRDAGPALNVSRADGSHVGMVRKGDYVCRQNTTVDDPNAPGGLRMLPDHLAVIPAAEFERLFRPVVRQTAEAEKPQAA